ncbi:MAG: precorrin-6A synthase (deacetylating) [Frankiales bacterium]|nr:precorrin-6A synthase (deacetylating) [Frankiales bacterium]
MREIRVIGIGAGDPEHLTLQAVRAMNECQVFLHMDKGSEKDSLAELRRSMLADHMTGTYEWVEVPDPSRDRTGPEYEGAVTDWHTARAALYDDCLASHEGVLGILVWGDPALYDSTLRVIALMQTPVAVTVIPGITSPQTLAAAHAVTWNRIAGAVHVTTGRRLRAEGMTASDVIVMLDSQNSFLGLDPSIEIFWGAYLGTPDEILLSGTIGSVGAEIEKVRAGARVEHGWIMDTYLLRQAT